jgi:DNA invertase Pin-like site-specific DNA recombinase
MLKDAVRRRFDILMVWSINRLGRSELHVANALAELDAAGMIQTASVFGEQKRELLRSRVVAGLERVRKQRKRLGHRKVSVKVEAAIRTYLKASNGILKVALLVGCGSGTMQRLKREMVKEPARSG